MISAPLWGMGRHLGGARRAPAELEAGMELLNLNANLAPEELVMQAINHESINELSEALAQSPNLASVDDLGYTPLLWVVTKTFRNNGVQQTMIEQLIRAGSDVNQAHVVNTLEGEVTPLHLAAVGKVPDLVAFLLAFRDEQGKRLVDVNKKSLRGETALHAAWQPAIISLLLDAGARVDIQDQNGLTPLDAAVLQLNLAKVKTLLSLRGKNIPLRDMRNALNRAKCKYLELESQMNPFEENKLLSDQMQTLKEIGKELALFSRDPISERGWLEFGLPKELTEEVRSYIP